jgi:large subunit ribosomal protein L31
MKKDIHPEYRQVIFKDVSTDFAILTKSTVNTSDTIVWEEDGKEYPLYKIDISSASHPFYTGKQKIMDTEGRIEKFQKKFGNSYSHIKSIKK